MAQLLASAALPPELDSPSFPSEFPYEVVDSFPSSLSSDTSDDDCDFADEDLFLRGLSQRLAHTSGFSSVPTWRLSVPSSRPCDGIPKARKLSVSPKSTLGGTGNWSTPVGVSQLTSPTPLPFPSDNDCFDLVYAATAHELARLKVAPEEPHFGPCRLDKSAPCRLIPEQDPLPSSRNLDPFSLPCFAQSTPRRHAREAEVAKQRHDALLLAQQRQLQIQAQIRAKKLGFSESSRFGRTYSFPQPGWAPKVGSGTAGPFENGSGSLRGCAGTGVFFPRGYGDVAPESRRKSGGTTPSVIVPAKVVRALNANVQLRGRDALLLGRRNALWMEQQHHHIRGLISDGSLNHEPCQACLGSGHIK